MDITHLVAFVAAVTVISLIPGPDMLFIIANGMAAGRRAGVVAALGMSTGLAVHTVAAALGLGALLAAAPAVLEVVRYVGAAFLVYLAISALRSSASRKPSSQADPVEPVPDSAVVPEPVRRLRRVYLMAVLTNLANPKVIFFYLALFPQFLTAGGSWPVTVQFLVLGLVFIVVGVIIDASAGAAAGSLSGLLLRRPGVRRWLDRVAAGIFAGLAVRLVTSE